MVDHGAFRSQFGRQNGLHDVAFLRNLEALGAYAEQYEQENGEILVGKTISVADMLKEIHKALNEDRPEFRVIPDNRSLIAQEFLLFESSGSDDLEDVIDSSFSMARLTAKTPWRDAASYVETVDALTAKARELFAGQAKVTATGLMVLFASSIHAMMQSTVVSYSIAGGIITVLMIIMLGSVRIGLLSMLPNIFPIVFTLGMMGWLGLPLDMFTMLIGSIAIGLAVDDTIHFFITTAATTTAACRPRRLSMKPCSAPAGPCCLPLWCWSRGSGCSCSPP